MRTKRIIATDFFCLWGVTNKYIRRFWAILGFFEMYNGVFSFEKNLFLGHGLIVIFKLIKHVISDTVAEGRVLPVDER